jgi:hypothetical protein
MAAMPCSRTNGLAISQITRLVVKIVSDIGVLTVGMMSAVFKRCPSYVVSAPMDNFFSKAAKDLTLSHM